MIRKKIFLVMLLFCSISIFGQTTKTIDELNLELKTATENNDFQKAEQLKKEIQQVEEKKRQVKTTGRR
jgi:excinuclease UvrABC helicase subunit UvrB